MKRLEQINKGNKPKQNTHACTANSFEIAFPSLKTYNNRRKTIEIIE